MAYKNLSLRVGFHQEPALVAAALVEVTMRVDETFVEEAFVLVALAAAFVVVECPSHPKTASVMDNRMRDLASMLF